MKNGSLKLGMDLVPKTCWHESLRKRMRRSEWDKLRRKVCADQAGICAICGGEGRLQCHEKWRYDDAGHTQTLVGFHAVCNMGHHVMHFGMAQILAEQGHLDLGAVIHHFMKVNHVGREAFQAHQEEAFRVYRERSKHVWKVDLGKWASLISDRSAEAPPR